MNPKQPFHLASLSIRHYPVVCVVVLTLPLSYRNLGQMMLEQGLTVDHTTVYRWVQSLCSQLDKTISVTLETN